MRERSFISRNAGSAALVISVIALVASTTGLADAARRAVVHAIDGHRISAKPYKGGLLVLGGNKKFPASAIPTVKNAQEVTAKASPRSNRAVRRARSTSAPGAWTPRPTR